MALRCCVVARVVLGSGNMNAKPNTPNSPAWTRPLTAPRPPQPKPRPGSRAARIALWTMPLDAVIANVKGGAR